MRKALTKLTALSAAIIVGATPVLAATSCNQNSISGDWVFTLTSSILNYFDGDEYFPQSIHISYCAVAIGATGAMSGQCYNAATDSTYTMSGDARVNRGCIFTADVTDGSGGEKPSLLGRVSSTPGSWPTQIDGIMVEENAPTAVGIFVFSFEAFRAPWNYELFGSAPTAEAE